MNIITQLATGFLSFISDFAGSFVKAELSHLLQQMIDKKLNEINISSVTYNETSNRNRELCAESDQLTIKTLSTQNDLRERLIERKIARSADPVVIFNNIDAQSSLIKCIENSLTSISNIKYHSRYNRAYGDLDKCIDCLGHLPVIHLTVQEKQHQEVIVSISTWNLIPGNKDIKSTQITIVLDKDCKANERMVIESIIYYIKVLKDTYHLYSDSIANQTARLELEANLLYQDGYHEIAFNPCDIGYYIELHLANNLVTVFLPFAYPIEEPLIMVGEGKSAYEITFAEGIWRPSISISQIISAIDKVVG